MYHRLFYDYRWNKIIDAESGMDDAESGMNDIKYKHYAQQTPQNYLQKFSFLRKENDLLFLIHSYVHPPPSFYDSNNDNTFTTYL